MKKYYTLLLLCLCGCAIAQPDGALPPVIDNSSYPTYAPPPSNPTNVPASNALQDLERINQLQAENQQLTGRVEEQGYQINELKKQLANMEERLRATESKNVTAPEAPAAETETPANTPSEPQAVQAQEPAKPAPEAPTSISVVTEKPTSAPQQATPTAKPEVNASADEKKVYQEAYTALRTGKTDQSIEQFKNYINQYPDGGYADVAHYWLGEAYRVKQDNAAAQQTFNMVLEKYPNSTKFADTLLKLGYVQIELKNNDKAREYLTRVINEFPNTPSAHAAEKKLAQLK